MLSISKRHCRIMQAFPKSGGAASASRSPVCRRCHRESRKVWPQVSQQTSLNCTAKYLRLPPMMKLISSKHHYETKMSTPPPIFVRLHKRWQPCMMSSRDLYTSVEFVQGILLDFDKDTCIDPNVRNLILDDPKDPRHLCGSPCGTWATRHSLWHLRYLDTL